MDNSKKKLGRPSTGINTVDIHYKMEKELFDSLPKEIKRNTYINHAVRNAMIKDGFIEEKHKKK